MIDSSEDVEDTNEPVVRKRSVRIKPSIEGINVSSSTVSVANKLASKKNREDEGKIMSSSIARRAGTESHPIRTFFVWLVLLAGLAFTGYWAYQLYWVQGSENQQVVDSNTEQTKSTVDTVSTTTPPDVAASSTPETVTASSTPTKAPELMSPMVKIGQTETGYLNVRSEPATSGKVIEKVKPGETYPYLSKKSGWYNITLPSGKTGWILGQYVTEL